MVNITTGQVAYFEDILDAATNSSVQLSEVHEVS